MITLIWRTDVHLADQAPASRVDVWSETLLGKIRQVGEIARQTDADAVLDGGDFFHVKSPTRNSHKLVNRAVAAHGAYPCPVYACIGNHDCKYGDYSYIDEQPLGTLFRSGVFKRLYDEYEAVFQPRPTTGMREDWTVRVVGVPYHGTNYDIERLRSIKKGTEKYLVVVAHLLASPSGGTMFESEDILKYSDLAELDPDIFCLGHWHKDQGVTEIASGKYVVNIGSLSRGALNQDDLNRTPSVAVLTFDQDIRIDVVPLDVAPADEVFDIEGRVRAEARDLNMESFVESIQGTLEESVGKPLLEIVRELPDIDERVREQAILYLEQA